MIATAIRVTSEIPSSLETGQPFDIYGYLEAGAAAAAAATIPSRPQRLQLETLAVVVAVNPYYQSGTLGETLTYAILVTNFGSYDTFTLSTVDTKGWAMSIEPTSLTIGHNASGAATLTVHIPIDAVDGEQDNITLTATSQSDPSLSASDTCVAVATIAILNMYVVLEVNGRAKYVVKTQSEGEFEFMDCLLPFGIPHGQVWRGTTNTVKVIFEGAADYAPSESLPYDVTMLMPLANYETDFITLPAGYYIELGFRAFGPKHLSITFQKEDPAGPDGELIYPAFPDAIAEDEWWWGWFALSNVGTVAGSFKVFIQEV